MKNLKNYIKPKTKDYVTTSVTIKAEHVRFLKEKNVNFSALVRDYLDLLILEAEKEPKKR